jgi:hypothetical protein
MVQTDSDLNQAGPYRITFSGRSFLPMVFEYFVAFKVVTGAVKLDKK